MADVVLVGAGIMSATLGLLLKELNPSLQIAIYELLEGPGMESSDAWNNAGTGHAANCELNYTPQRADGSIDISKALKINVEFDLSRQFWAYLVKQGAIRDPHSFINPVPHISFVTGEANTAFLKKRHATMSAHPCYRGMEYTEDRSLLQQWVPLMMKGRSADQKVAATRMITGTDVDYGSLTRGLMKHLTQKAGVSVHYFHKVTDLKRDKKSGWCLTVRDEQTKQTQSIKAKSVFLGAGGGTILLLQKSGIPEVKGYAGFPVSGVFLWCDQPQIANQHQAKVYGKAEVGTPPMSVPHLDTRIMGGKRDLLFGPYAGFSTRFLKHGSLLDLFRSIKFDNIPSLLSVAIHNIPLTKYLIGQVLQSSVHRFAALQAFYPEAKKENWSLKVAGQRVQIIRPTSHRGATLEFGTELLASADRSLVGLMGASPGASTSTYIAVELIEKYFGSTLLGKDWPEKLKELIPSYGESLIENADLCQKIRAETASVLGLKHI